MRRSIGALVAAFAFVICGSEGSRSSETLTVARGDVVCDMTTGIAAGVGAGTCVAIPAKCNGDYITISRNISTMNFGSTLRVFVDTFNEGDVNKRIIVPGAASGSTGSYRITAVGAFNGSTQDIKVTPVVRATIINQPTDISYGTDDSPAFAAFNSWANLTWQASHSGLVEQYIPPGKTCQILSTALNTPASAYDPNCGLPTYGFACTWGGGGWSKGIRKFLMNFAGSSVNSFPGTGAEFALAAGDGVCHRGIYQKDGCTALTADASKGETSVTLLKKELCSRFTVGNYAFLTGYDTQGLYSPTSGYGYPPNPAFYDHVKITSLANCSTLGTVNFDRQLTNDYKSTWPRNCVGNAHEADCGGPATLYALPFWWDTEVEYRGGTFSTQTNLTNDAGRKVTFRDITLAGKGFCPYPTQNTEWNVIGGKWLACVIEIDKIVESVSFKNTSVYRPHYQSMSPRNTTVTNSTFTQLTGAGRHMSATNLTVSSTAEVFTSATAFGRTDSWSCNGCTMNGAIGIGSASGQGTVISGAWGLKDQSSNTHNSTMRAGVITVPNKHGALEWAMPGTNFTWAYAGAGQSSYVYQVQNITQDATNQYVITNCVGSNTVCGSGGGFPISSGSLTLRVHPAPKFNCTECDLGSSRQWAAVNNAPTDAPLFSYAKYKVDNTWPTTAAAAYSFIVWGKLTSITATVNSPYAGAGALNWRPTGQFLYSVAGKTGTLASYVPSIDLKMSGTRTLLPNGTGGIGADSNTTPFAAPLWFATTTAGVISSQPAWTGNADITIVTDQGVVNP